MSKDLYAVLGVSRRADEAVLKAAYRKLAKSCHPDLHAGAAAERRFKEINLAYETLGDADARAAYDDIRVQRTMRLRRDLRSAMTTMSASFVLTVTWGYFAAKWLLGV